LWIRAINKSGATIVDGSVVYLSGAQGSRPKAWLALATDNIENLVVGVATADIENNQEGHITTFGIVNGVDMSSYSDGDVLYLSPTIPGGLTTTRPSPPNHAVKIGNVTRNQNNGALLVSVDAGSDITELHDVLITNPQDRDVITYDSNLGIWTNQASLTGVSISEPIRTTLIGDGTTTVFSISGADNTTNAASLIVAIDGALQEPDVDYTVNYGNITFTSPILSGAKAVVVSPYAPTTTQIKVSEPIRTTLIGDGTTTVFFISGADNTTNAASLIVAIDGALQEPDVDYTISFGDITFTSPILSGAKAVVVSPYAPTTTQQRIIRSYYRETAIATTLQNDDSTLNVTSPATIQLPTASSIVGVVYTIKNTSNGVVTISGYQAETIDFNNTINTSHLDSLTIQSTGANWIII
jgi:hypothetical protein